MENVNTRKLIFLLMLLISGCKEKATVEVNIYEVGNEVVYDTLGTTTNETLKLLNTLNSLMSKGESKYKGYSWIKERSYNDSLTYYDVTLTKEQDVYDFQIYRLNNRIILFRNPESTDYRLVMNIKCIGTDCQEIEFTGVLAIIDSTMIPLIPSIDDEEDVLEADSVSINL